MKKLILSSALLPLICFGAQERATKAHGPEKCYLRSVPIEILRGIDDLISHYDLTPLKGQPHTLTKEILIDKYLDTLRKRSSGWDNDHIRVSPYLDISISNALLRSQCAHTREISGSYTNISNADCEIIRTSLLQKLDLSQGTFDIATCARIRQAWTAPTDFFPQGRDLNNLKLPAQSGPEHCQRLNRIFFKTWETLISRKADAFNTQAELSNTEIGSKEDVTERITQGLSYGMIYRSMGSNLQTKPQNKKYSSAFVIKAANDTQITQNDCDFLATSLIISLDLSACAHLDESCKERVRKIWAMPTDIFPKGRNPANLILPTTTSSTVPQTVTTSSATDNKDQKS